MINPKYIPRPLKGYPAHKRHKQPSSNNNISHHKKCLLHMLQWDLYNIDLVDYVHINDV